MFYPILVLALVALDQYTKHLVLTHLPLGEHFDFLPPLVDLVYVQNTGAAFSMLSDHTWFLTLISLVLSLGLAWAVHTKFFTHPFGRISLAVVLAGALGNLIDRAFRGFVVDMLNFMFVRFAVFNVADICVVLGGICAGFYYLFLYEKYQPQESAQESSQESQESPQESSQESAQESPPEESQEETPVENQENQRAQESTTPQGEAPEEPS